MRKESGCVRNMRRAITTSAGCWLHMVAPGRRFRFFRRQSASIPTIPRPTTIWVPRWRPEGRLAEAIVEFQTALRLKPDYANAHLNLGKALANSGRMEEAAAQFSEALRADPNLKEAREALEIVSPPGGVPGR